MSEAEKTGKQRFCDGELRFQGSYMLTYMAEEISESSAEQQHCAGRNEAKLYKRSYTCTQT